MTFLKRILCRDNSAVINNYCHDDSNSPTNINNTGVIVIPVKVENDIVEPIKENTITIIEEEQQQEPNYVPTKNLITTIHNLMDMTDIDLTETDHDYSSNDDDSESNFQFSSIIGKTLSCSHLQEPVHTDDALKDSTLVAIYYADGPNCLRETELLSFFDAGYEYKTLNIVYCSKNDDEDDNEAFINMPARWWKLSDNNDVKKSFLERYGVDRNNNEPTLIIIDPNNGRIVSDTALDDILALDVYDNTSYDDKAHNIFQEWIMDMDLQQHIIGEMEIRV